MNLLTDCPQDMYDEFSDKDLRVQEETLPLVGRASAGVQRPE